MKCFHVVSYTVGVKYTIVTNNTRSRCQFLVKSFRFREKAGYLGEQKRTETSSNPGAAGVDQASPRARLRYMKWVRKGTGSESNLHEILKLQIASSGSLDHAKHSHFFHGYMYPITKHKLA